MLIFTGLTKKKNKLGMAYCIGENTANSKHFERQFRFEILKCGKGVESNLFACNSTSVRDN